MRFHPSTGSRHPGLIMLPAYGRQLLDLRRSGRRPARPVIVADTFEVAACMQRIHDRYALVVADPLARLDWALVAGLEVGVSVRLDQPAPWFRALRAARPASLRVKFSDASESVEDHCAALVLATDPVTRPAWVRACAQRDAALVASWRAQGRFSARQLELQAAIAAALNRAVARRRAQRTEPAHA